MPVALLLVLALIIVAMLMWLTFGIVHLALTFFVAGVIGWAADELVPGRLPWGWLGAILAGMLGSWLGVAIIGRVGPGLFGVQIIPTFVGALILALVFNVVAKLSINSRRL